MRVTFADGSCGDYDLVVGADGIGSTVRRLAVSDVAPTRTPTVGWRGVVAGRPAGVDHLVLLLGEGCFLGLVPVGGGDTYGFAGTAPGTSRSRTASPGSAGPRRTSSPASTPRRRRTLPRSAASRSTGGTTGRVVLIGDAAHATHPHMGQGGSLAVEDALVLADELARADRLPAALHAHTRRRRPRVDWVHEQSGRAAAAWMLPAAERDAALRSARRPPPPGALPTAAGRASIAAPALPKR